jgi:hypothetical protein
MQRLTFGTRTGTDLKTWQQGLFIITLPLLDLRGFVFHPEVFIREMCYLSLPLIRRRMMMVEG